MQISDAARPWLALLAAHRRVTSELHVDARALADVESVLESVIPWDIVALLAIEGRPLSALVTLTAEIREFYNVMGDGPTPTFAHVALAVTNDRDGDHGGAEPFYAAFARTRNRDHVTVIEWVLYKPSPGAHPYSLERYVREVRGVTAPLEPDALPPTISVTQPTVAVEFVTHAKFGRGRVVRRGEGKVTVEFADATRTLGEAYVQPAE